MKQMVASFACPLMPVVRQPKGESLMAPGVAGGVIVGLLCGAVVGQGSARDFAAAIYI